MPSTPNYFSTSTPESSCSTRSSLLVGLGDVLAKCSIFMSTPFNAYVVLVLSCFRLQLTLKILTATWHPFYRSLATEAVPSSSSASSSVKEPPRTLKRLPKPEIHTSIILNRSPIITRTPSLFERAYYAYQARIRRALQNPFSRDFYFKQGSVVETKFKMEERARERKAFGPKFGLIEDEEDANKESQEAAIAKLNELEQDSGEDALAPRVHPADENRDYKSLDRKGRRNIYLLLLTQGTEGKDVWRFPQGGVEKGELLHQVCTFIA